MYRLTVHVENPSFVNKEQVMIGKDLNNKPIMKPKKSKCIVNTLSYSGMGTLKEQADGTKLVSDDFHLATAADIVADPSAPNAFVQGIMEGREWVWDNGSLKEQDLEKLKKELDVSKSLREERALQAFENFIKNVKI